MSAIVLSEQPQPMMSNDSVSDRLARRHTRNLREKAIETVLLCAALVSVATTVGIVFILVKESLVFYKIWEKTRDAYLLKEENLLEELKNKYFLKLV